MFRRNTDEDLTDDVLENKSSRDVVTDYKTEVERGTNDYLKSREKAIAELESDETILWEGRPNMKLYRKVAYVGLRLISSVFVAIDVPLMIIFMISFKSIITKIILLTFFAIHLTPLWLYITTIIQKNEVENSLYYMFTNKRIIVSYSRNIVSTYLSLVTKVECTQLNPNDNIGSFRFLQSGDMENGKGNIVLPGGPVDTSSFLAVNDFNKIFEIVKEYIPENNNQGAVDI